MKRFAFLTASIAILAAIVWLLSSAPKEAWPVCILLAVAFILMVSLWFGVVESLHKVERGYDILGSQDFNNTLTIPAQPDAAKLARLFNTMILKLRDERLHNLEQEGLLSQIVDVSPMGIVILDLDNKIKIANGAFYRLTSISPDEAPAGTVFNAIEIPTIGMLREIPARESRTFRFADTKICRCSHLNFVKSGFYGSFYIIENITDEMAAAERAAYAKVIRTMAHEVNNTLAGVRSVVAMLAESSDNEETALVAESCDERCQSLSSFIEAYADVVRLPQPVLKWRDLSEEIQRLMPFLISVYGKGIDIRMIQDDSNGLLKVNIDSAMIEQVVVNIVKNAVESFDFTDVFDQYKESEQERFIEIRTGEKNGHITLTISNNGRPIDPETARNIFSPFFTTKPNGKGIGLTLISEILRRHNADFSLSTDTSGITRFQIHF